MDEQRQREIAATVDALNRHIREHEISDFRIKGLEGETLSLVGSFDLSYYYDIEIVMTGVSWLNLPCYFWVDLAQSQPFSVGFPAQDTAVCSFMDRGAAGGGRSPSRGTSPFRLSMYPILKDREVYLWNGQAVCWERYGNFSTPLLLRTNIPSC